MNRNQYDQTDFDKNFMSFAPNGGKRGCTCGNSGRCLSCSQKQLESEVFNFASDCGCGGHSNYAGKGDCGCGGHSNYADFSPSDIQQVVVAQNIAEQTANKTKSAEKKPINKTMVIIGVGLLLFAGYKLYKSKK